MNTLSLTPRLRSIITPFLFLSLFSATLLRASLVYGDDTYTEIIPMQYRPAEILIQDLRPLMDSSIRLTASGNNLIARGSRGEITALKLLVEELDQPLAQFKISIRQGNSSNQSSTNISYRHNGEHIQISPGTQTTTIRRDGIAITRTTKSSSDRVVLHRNSRLGNNQLHQQVRATEGYPAYIEMGKKVPITSLLFHSTTHQPIIHQEYEPVVSGFYVTPQLANDREVLLQLSTQKQELKLNNRVDVQRYGGTVRGRLNEWIAIGGVADSKNDNSTGLSRHRTSKLSKNGTIYLKVERVAH